MTIISDKGERVPLFDQACEEWRTRTAKRISDWKIANLKFQMKAKAVTRKAKTAAYEGLSVAKSLSGK